MFIGVSQKNYSEVSTKFPGQHFSRNFFLSVKESTTNVFQGILCNFLKHGFRRAPMANCITQLTFTCLKSTTMYVICSKLAVKASEDIICLLLTLNIFYISLKYVQSSGVSFVHLKQVNVSWVMQLPIGVLYEIHVLKIT